jgi:predicted MFS family arabinose efflux permease
MDTTGAVIGVALAALIVGAVQGDDTNLQGDTFRLLALAALIPGLLALVAIAVGVRDVPKPAPVPATEPRSDMPTPDMSTPAREPTPATGAAPATGLHRFPTAFWIFVAASGLFTLGNSSDAFIALRSQALGVAVRDLLLIVIAFNIVDALVAWPIGALSDRIGRRRLIAVAWSLYALTYVGLALAGSADAVLPLWLLYGAYYGVNEAVGRALVADLALPDLRATAYGIFNAVIGLAILPASIVAGLLWDRVGQSAPFWFGAACAIGGLVLLVFVRPARRPAPAVA